MMWGIFCLATVPFANRYQRESHFKRHGPRLGAVDAAHYERMADALMLAARNAETDECTRINHDIVRLDFVRRHFGVACLPTTVRTFYLVDLTAIAYRGGAPGYLAHQCGRTDL